MAMDVAKEEEVEEVEEGDRGWLEHLLFREVDDLQHETSSSQSRPLVRHVTLESNLVWDRLRWRTSCLMVASLMVLVALAKTTLPSVLSLRSKAIDKELVSDWEQIPGMERVIQHAQRLEFEHPPRNLSDLFYETQTEELPFVRTECVIDVVQATAFLGQAIIFLYRAIDYNGFECPDNSPDGCAVSVSGFIASVTWVASYLSFAASACAQALNSGALCAGDFATLMANFAEIANAGAAVKHDCNFILNAKKILLNPPHRPSGWHQFIPAGAGPKMHKVLAIKGLQEHRRNRDFDVSRCVLDSVQIASLIVRALLQVRRAGEACPEPRACAINIMNVISSFAWLARFSLYTVSDCESGVNRRALCGADVTNLVHSVTNGPAAGIATTSDCVANPNPKDEEQHLPMN